MATIVEILGATVASHASNGNNVGLSSTVKVVAGSASNLELHTASKGALIGTVCMASGETMYIKKAPTNELAAADNATSWKFSPVNTEG
jgi:hypothetical protein